MPRQAKENMIMHNIEDEVVAPGPGWYGSHDDWDVSAISSVSLSLVPTGSGGTVATISIEAKGFGSPSRDGTGSYGDRSVGAELTHDDLIALRAWLDHAISERHPAHFDQVPAEYDAGSRFALPDPTPVLDALAKVPADGGVGGGLNSDGTVDGLNEVLFICDDCRTTYPGPIYYSFPFEDHAWAPDAGDCTGNLCPSCAGPGLTPDDINDPRRVTPDSTGSYRPHGTR